MKLFIWSLCPFRGLQDVSTATARAGQAKTTAFALSKAFKVSQKSRQGQNKLYSKPLPFQRSSRCLKSHGKGRTSFIRSLCPFKGLQDVSKATARAEQAKTTAFALSKAFKAVQKPRQGQNKLKPQHLPFQRPSRCLKNHGKGRTRSDRRPALRLNLRSTLALKPMCFGISYENKRQT